MPVMTVRGVCAVALEKESLPLAPDERLDPVDEASFREADRSLDPFFVLLFFPPLDPCGDEEAEEENKEAISFIAAEEEKAGLLGLTG